MDPTKIVELLSATLQPGNRPAAEEKLTEVIQAVFVQGSPEKRGTMSFSLFI